MSAAPTENVAPSKDASSAAALPTVVSSSSSSSSSSVQRLRGIDDVALDIAEAVAQSRTLTAALNLCDDAAKCALLDRQLERLAKREEHLRDELRQLRTEYKQAQPQHIVAQRRSDLTRWNEKLEALEVQLASASLAPDDKASLARRRAVLLGELERTDADVARLSAELQRPSLLSPFMTTVRIEDVSEVVLWRNDVRDRNVARTIVSPDAMLAPPRHLLPEMRWLQLQLMASDEDNLNNTSLAQIQWHRRERKRDAADLEVPYHPALLLFYQAASAGQADLQFLEEDHSAAKPREDVRGLVRGARMEPQECKVEYAWQRASDEETIDANAEPIGKLFQVCRSACLPAGQACRRLCSFTSRIEYIWFVDFDFAADGLLQQCSVAPGFPAKGDTSVGNVLCPLRHIDDPHAKTLAHILPTAPTPGFRLLVRYVDTLASIHGLPSLPLALRREDGSIVDVVHASVLAHGHHSLVLQLSADAQSIVKISRSAFVAHERLIHNVVDGASPYLRAMLPNGFGTVEGAGVDLSFIELAGLGEPLVAAHVATAAQLAQCWDQAALALSAMHEARVLHRDLKPSNMVMIRGSLVINDFDVACMMDSEAHIKQLQVGTRAFHSPKLVDKWRPRDEWLSLALAFLSLRLPDPFSNKTAALESALNASWVPEAMKAAIKRSFR